MQHDPKFRGSLMQQYFGNLTNMTIDTPPKPQRSKIEEEEGTPEGKEEGKRNQDAAEEDEGDEEDDPHDHDVYFNLLAALCKEVGVFVLQ